MAPFIQDDEARSGKSEEELSEHVETRQAETMNLPRYDDADVEPDLPWRTCVAVFSMFLILTVQLVALQGPPAMLYYIGASFPGNTSLTWVVNSLSLVQAVITPVISSLADIFESRKPLLICCSWAAFVGAAIAPGSQSIYRLIGAQILIGFGFSVGVLAYCVPSEILPRKWRPMAQATLNVGSALGACLGPLAIGALTKHDPLNGWRRFYWMQMALWGVVIVTIWIGYRPPKSANKVSRSAVLEKLRAFDFLGLGLFATGLTLLLAALNFGGVQYSWTDRRVLILLVLGLVLLAGFVAYEWKGTTTGVLNHELFRGGRDAGRTFSICIVLIAVEAILLFAYALYFPVMTTSLFERDPLLLVAREQAYWIAMGVSTVPWAYLTSNLKTIKVPLFLGYLIYTAGTIGFATIQPGDSINSIAFSVVSGIGFGAPLILLISAVQLAAPHRLIATATAIVSSARALAATVFTAIYSAVYANAMASKLPKYVTAAALEKGLSPQYVGDVLHAIGSPEEDALSRVPGMSEAIANSIHQAQSQATADSVRLNFIIAAAFGACACLLCYFLGSLKDTMNYRIDAPIEEIQAKEKKPEGISRSD